MQMMGKKMAMKASADEVSKNQPDGKVTLTQETKVVAGFKCRKAIITTTVDGHTVSNDCWYTDKLPIISAAGYTDMYKDIKGFMLEYGMKQQGITLHMKARKVSSQKLAPEWFQVPKDYDVVTQQQLMEKMGMPSDTAR
jgi:hypothetical protein